MKRFLQISSFCLLLALLIPMFNSLLLHYEREQWKHHMKEALEKEQLHTLELSSLNWYEKGKEIIVDGKMFDVKTVKKVNGGYVVTGLFDHEEKTLEKKAEKLAKQSDRSRGVAAFMMMAVYHERPIQFIVTPPSSHLRSFSFYHSPHYINNVVDVALRPPAYS